MGFGWGLTAVKDRWFFQGRWKYSPGALWWQWNNSIKDEKNHYTHNQYGVLVTSPVQLSGTPWMVAHQAPLSLGFSRQEYWSRLPFPPPGHLSHPGIEPKSPASANWQADSFLLEPLGKQRIGVYKKTASITPLLCAKHKHFTNIFYYFSHKTLESAPYLAFKM